MTQLPLISRDRIAAASTGQIGSPAVRQATPIAALLVLAVSSAAAGQDHAGANAEGVESAHPAARTPEDPMIVVTASRRGEALVAAETELLEPDIGIYAADTIQELIAAIAPEIDGSGELPELVINGERVDPSLLRAFPPEALERLAVLDPAAAARYGFDPGKRVVNLVLKKNYASWSTVAGLSGATRGGRRGEQLSVGRFQIADDLRWNVQASGSREGSLLKSDRELPVEEADELVAAKGLDPRRYETLLPSTHSLSLNGGLTHPIGELSGTLSLNANATGGESLLGLARGDPERPGNDAGRLQPLRAANSARGLGMRTSLSGSVAGWRTNASLSAAQRWTESRFDRSAFERDIGRVTDRTEGISRTLGARIDAGRDILELPAGPAGLALYLRVDFNDSSTVRWSSDGSGADFAASRGGVAARASLNLPIASRARDVLQPLGDLSVELGTEAEKVSGAPPSWRWNAGGTWSPADLVRFRVIYEYEQRQPKFEQLNGPLLETVDRVFDFTRQEVVETVRITGGNPDLLPGNVQRLSIGAMLRPLGDQALTLNLTYRSERKVGGIAGLPGLTPAVEAAFPERFIRDDEGRLIAVDARPINIASERSGQVNARITGRWSSGGDSPLRLNATLSYRRQLEDIVVTDLANASIDRLEQGEASRDRGNIRIVAVRSGLGMTLSGTWSGASFVAGGGGYRYAPTALFDLGFHVEPEHFLDAGAVWAENLKITLDFANVLAGYRRVITLDRAPAPGFERDRIDPLGRTVKLSVTKRF